MFLRKFLFKSIRNASFFTKNSRFVFSTRNSDDNENDDLHLKFQEKDLKILTKYISPDIIPSFSKIFDNTKGHISHDEYLSMTNDVFRINIEEMPIKYLYILIKYFGSNPFRRSNSEKSRKILLQLITHFKNSPTFHELLRLQWKNYKYNNKSINDNEFEKIFPQCLVHILISCSNLNLHDEELFKICRDFFLSEPIENKLPLSYSIIGLLWAYKRLCAEEEVFYTKIFNNLHVNIPKMKFVNILRLLWIVSTEIDKHDQEFVTQLITAFLRAYITKDTFAFNNKNNRQICEICFSLYPFLLQNYDIQYSKEERPITLKRSLDGAKLENDLKNNKYGAYFHDLYKIFCVAENIIFQNQHRLKIGNHLKQILYVEQNKADAPSIYVFRNQLNGIEAKFENNVKNTLAMINGVQFFQNAHAGIFEIDLIINPRLAIDVNGSTHYVYGTNKLIANHIQRNKFLSMIGLKFVQIPHFEWELLEKEDQKITYLTKKIQEQIGLIST